VVAQLGGHARNPRWRCDGAAREPVALPTFGSGGLQPGVDLDDSAALLGVMEDDAQPNASTIAPGDRTGSCSASFARQRGRAAIGDLSPAAAGDRGGVVRLRER
jgi:hypothetical protein